MSTCKCIDRMNDVLAQKNTKIVCVWPITADMDIGPTRPKIETEKIDKKRRGGLHGAIAAFCPFCGKKYEDKNKTWNDPANSPPIPTT